MPEFENYLEERIEALEAGQSGASVGVTILQFALDTQGTLSICSNVLAEVALVEGAINLTLVTMPLKVGAGGIFGKIQWVVPTLPAGALSVNYYELAASNADSTQLTVLSAVDAIPDLITGTGAFTDLGNVNGHIGNDLTGDASGGIVSAAGGVFTVQAVVQLLWTPA